MTTNNQSDILSIAGIVTSVNTPSTGNLRVRPVGRIVSGLPTLPGSVGAVLYFDPTQPNNLSATAPSTGVALPVYIKIDNTTAILLPKAISSGGTGTSGTSGGSGTAGTSGATGTSGTSGGSGTAGTSGSSTGTSGTSGGSGTAGTSGFTGTSGTSGLTGTAGTSGSSTGTSGTSGGAGTAGTSGAAAGFLGTSGGTAGIPRYAKVTMQGDFGMDISGVIADGTFPTFTYPVSTVQVVDATSNIKAQTITVNLDYNGGPTQFCSLAMIYNTIQIGCIQIPTLPTPGYTYEFTLPIDINTGGNLIIKVIAGTCSVVYDTIPVAYSGMSLSSNGQVVAFGSSKYYSPQTVSGRLNISNDGGTSWFSVSIGSNVLLEYWGTVSVSGNGTYILAGSLWQNGPIYKSTNSGVTFTQITLPGSLNPSRTTGRYYSSAMSYDGQYQIIGQYVTSLVASNNDRGGIFSSNDYGATWTLIYDNYCGVLSSAMNYTGQYQYVGITCGDYFVFRRSTDYGATWNDVAGWPVQFRPRCISTNSVGDKIYVAGNTATAFNNIDGYYIYKSIDYGTTWTPYISQSTVYADVFWQGVEINDTSMVRGWPNITHAGYLWDITNTANISSSPSLVSKVWTSVASTPDGTIIYAGSLTGIYKSTNSGTTWVNLGA